MAKNLSGGESKLSKFRAVGILALVAILAVTLSACDLADEIEDEYEDEVGEQFYNLTVEYEGMGNTTPPAGTHEYEQGSMVTLEAVPYHEDWEFAYWEGNVSNRHEASTQVYMDRDKEVNAVFVEREDTSYDLTINYEGRGETNPPMGTEEYDANELVEIVADPAEGWEFDFWRGDVMEEDDNEAYVYMDGDREVTAVFKEEEPEEEKYQLTVDQDGQGEVVPSVGVHEYDEYTLVELEAYPAEGWKFEEWRGDVTDPYSSQTTLLLEQEEMRVTAVFTEEEIELEEVGEIETVSVEHGTTWPEAEEELPESVTFTFSDGGSAEAELGWEEPFYYNPEPTEEESYDISGIATVNYEGELYEENVETELIVEQEPVEYYSLTVDIEGQGNVEKEPDLNEYEEGSEVTLMANPADGWEFDYWSGPDMAETEELTVTMDEDKSLTAHFVELPDDDDEEEEEEQDPVEGFNRYYNPYYSIDYPENWMVEETMYNVSFLESEYQYGYEHAVVVALEQGVNQSSQEFYQETLRGIEHVYYYDELQSGYYGTLDGSEAYWIEVKGAEMDGDQTTRVRLYYIITVHENDGYAVANIEDEETFTDHSLFFQMVDTFRFE